MTTPKARSAGVRASVALGFSVGVAAISGCGFFDQTEFAPEEWQRLQTLTSWNDAEPAPVRGIGLPPGDPSNRWLAAGGAFPYEGYPVSVDGTLSPAAALGKLFFFDTRFSGASTGGDFLGRVRPAHTRVPIGQPTGLACVSCHDLGRAGSDPLSAPIAIGAGSIGANAPALANVGFFPLLHWNGRFDSLWSQALVVTEVPIVQNATRLEVAWTIWRFYRDKYQAVFGEPVFGLEPSRIAALDARFGPSATQCTTSVAGTCDGDCVAAAGGCWPRFPRAGTGSPTSECVDPGITPWDCMSPEDRVAVTTVFVNFGKAIAAFEATLVAGNSPFDSFMHEGKDSTILNASAKRGARLFVTKGSCFNCHNTPLFSNRFFNNVAVAATGPLELTTADCPAGSPACDCTTPARADGSCLPWGALTGLELLRTFPLRRSSSASDAPDDTTVATFLKESFDKRFGYETVPVDAGGLPTQIPRELKWGWRTPTLRNVAVTAPYMHNGRYATLAEVVHHYNVGGDAQAPGPHPVLIKPLGLTADEEEDLVAFLRSLTSAPWPDAIAAPPNLPGAVP